jgi:hypothetical protein
MTDDDNDAQAYERRAEPPPDLEELGRRLLGTWETNVCCVRRVSSSCHAKVQDCYLPSSSSHIQQSVVGRQSNQNRPYVNTNRCLVMVVVGSFATRTRYLKATRKPKKENRDCA